MQGDIDIGGAGGASETVVGESGRVSDSTGGVSSIIASYVDNSGRDDGIAGLERGERRSSLSSSGPSSGSVSLRRLLTRFAGGEFASGGEGGGGVTEDVVHNRGAFSQGCSGI